MHRRSFLPILLVALVALVASCNDGPTSISNGIITATREATGIRLNNETNEARAYLINDPEFLALADLSLTAFCITTDSACLRLPAKGSALVPFADVGGYNATAKSVEVWTWRVMPGGAGGLQAVMDPAITLKF